MSPSFLLSSQNMNPFSKKCSFILQPTILSMQVLQAYKEFMVKVGTLLGGELNATRAQMEEVFQFEKKLAEIYEPKERLRNMEEIYHKITVADLQQLAPAVRKCALQG